MATAQLIPNNIDAALTAPATTTAKGLVAQAAMMVVTRVTKGDAERLMLELADAEKAIRAVFDPVVSAAHEAHKRATAARGQFLDPIAAQRTRLRGECARVQRELEDEAQAEAKRLAAELETQERARIADEATALADAGDTEAALDVLEQQKDVFVAPTAVRQEVETTAGVTYRDNWTFSYVDAAGKPIDSPDLRLIPLEFLKVDESAIRKVVGAMKNRTNIPGIRAFNNKMAVAAGRRSA